jgi:AcrR family transcriptional regulator
LFSGKGYLATSIEDIAAEAGVARPTVFTAVGPKATILRLVVDQALAGDDAPVPIAERPWWREAVDEPDAVRSVQLAARNMCLINQRSAPLLRALEIAASVDDEARAVWSRFQQQRHDGLNEFALALSRKTDRVRYDESTMTDTLWMLTPDAYLRLVHDNAWPLDRFQGWLTDVLLRLFLDVDDAVPGDVAAGATTDPEASATGRGRSPGRPPR